MDLGYKMFVRPEDQGTQERYPQHYNMRVSSTHLKGYSGRLGGHNILMLNGWLTLVVNLVLLVIVLFYFTPVVFT